MVSFLLPPPTFFRLISRLQHEPVDVLVAEMHAVRGRRKRKMLHGVDERNSEIIRDNFKTGECENEPENPGI